MISFIIFLSFYLLPPFTAIDDQTRCKSMNYYLLKTFSRQPIQFGRFIARMLAGLVNTLKITRTSKV